MAVRRRRVVQTHLDPLGAQQLGQPVARRVAHREEVVDAGRPGALAQEDELVREPIAQPLCVAATRRVPGVEVGQLDPQQRRLQPVQPLVVADHDVLALAALAEMAQLPDTSRELSVVGTHRAPVAERAEVLARVERERRRVAERARRACRRRWRREPARRPRARTGRGAQRAR